MICGWLLMTSLNLWSFAERPPASVNATDYPSIHAAVAALPEAGGTVLIPDGTHEIGNSIIVEQSDVSIIGAGSGTVLKNVSSTGAHTFVIRGRSGRDGRIWRVKISDMHLRGNPNSGHGVYAFRVNELALNDMWVDHHGGSGLYLDDCYENPRVFDNNIAYNREYGIFLRGCHDIVVSANQLEENGYGIYAVEVWNVGVTGNSVDDHLHHSLYFKKALGSIVSSNMFENSIKACLVLDSGCNGVTVTGNVMRYSGPVLLRLLGVKGITVTGNTFESDQGTCVVLEGGSNLVTLSGNVFFGFRRDPIRGMEWGVVLDDVDGISISGNTIVEPFAGGIYASGSSQRHLTITGNTVKNASWKSPGKYSGILLNNTFDSVLSGNLVLDDGSEPRLKAAIEEAGASDYNLITNNQVSKGRSGDIIIRGANTKKGGNRSLVR
jgi:parallel beta-helix repeat protein